MKSQVDVALLIGSIVIPSAALLGALIFSFTLLGPLTDIAKVAAVISHDSITLVDIAYSVPGNLEIHYKPPSVCKFADLYNPDAGCTSSPVTCSTITEKSKCNSFYGCKWDTPLTSKCGTVCDGLGETDCANEGPCYWDDGTSSCVSTGGYHEHSGCTPSFDDNGNLDTDCCREITDEAACEVANGCSWVDPHINGLSCLGGAMNISRFEVALHKENTTLLNGFEDFPVSTESYFPAIISKKYYSKPLRVPYPGYANILDEGFTSNVRMDINKDEGYISISKVRDGGVYDTIGHTNYIVGPLEDIAAFVKGTLRCDSGYVTYKTFVPQFYFLNGSGSTICWNRVAQSPLNVTNTSMQVNYTIYCFDFDKLNVKTYSNIDSYSFNVKKFSTYDDYNKSRIVTIGVTPSVSAKNCDITISKVSP